MSDISPISHTSAASCCPTDPAAESSGSDNLLNNLLDLIDKHGLDAVAGAMHNDQLKEMIEFLKDEIRGSDMPQFLKDEAIEMLDGKLDELQQPTTDECGCDVENTDSSGGSEASESGGAGGSEGSNATEMLALLSQLLMQDNIEDSEETGAGEGGGAGGKGGKGGGNMNWLEALAHGMAEGQIKWLDKAMEYNAIMKENAGADSEDTESRDAFIMAQSKYQAATQMFSMMANMTSTSLKTIGEGLNSIARKQ